MSPETQQKLAKVRKYSASLSNLFKLLFALVAIAGVVALGVAGIGRDIDLSVGGVVYRGEEITTAVRVLGAIGIGLGTGIALKLNYHLIRLFGLYAQGQIFLAENVRQIRQIGISVFLFIVVWLYEIVSSAILMRAAPVAADGTQTIGFGLGGGPFGVAIAGIIVVVISWIMDVGRELREEQDLTV